MAKTFALLVAGLLLAFGLDAFLSEFIDDYVVRIINLCGIAIVLAVSLNVINGLCGQFSLGHAGFMAIGAYVCAWFTTTLRYFDPEVARYVSSDPVIASQWGFLPGLIAGGLVAALAGLIVGIPTLRLKGDYLAIATLGFGEIVRVIITNVPQIGGATGLPGLPPYSTTAWIFGVCAICIIFSINLQRSTFGRALIAIRENELAAETMGVNAARLKVMAFIYGAFFAGVAGGLLGHLMQTISPLTFNFMKSIEVVVMLVLGGLGSMTGAIVGAVVLTVLPEALRDLETPSKGSLLVVHRLVYALFLLPVFLILLYPLRHKLRQAQRFAVAAILSLGGCNILVLLLQQEDGTQPALQGARMVVYSLILIMLMIFRPQGIFGQRELSLKLLRRLIPGGKDKS